MKPLRFGSNWLILACYAAIGSGALVALHRTVDHAHNLPTPVVLADAHGCCTAAADHAVPAGHDEHPAQPESGDDTCSLCDALASVGKARVEPSADSLSIPRVITSYLLPPTSEPNTAILALAVRPRAPPMT